MSSTIDAGSSAPAESAEGPVFIIGCPRSGTSALSWAVAQHPAFWTSAESDFMHHLLGAGKLHAAYRRAFDRPDNGWLRKHGVGYDEFCSFLGSGVDALFRSRSKGKRWVDATPGHSLMAEDLARMFPTARFLHIVRDGRAVVCSMLNSGFDFDWSKDFRQACFTWSHYVRKGLEFEKGSFGERVLRVRHEGLVGDPETTSAAILDFLGVEYAPQPALFLANRRINSSYDNVEAADIRKVKDTARLKERPWDAWSGAEHKVFVEAAGDAMTQAGIPTTPG